MIEEIIDGVALASAMKKLSALGEYLLLDDINDLGKLDHFHHYIVGLILWLLGVGGEMAGKMVELLNGFSPQPPQSQPQPQLAVPQSDDKYYYIAGVDNEPDEGLSPFEHGDKKMILF